jgi:putative SOS response-associated peptidase YedK
MERSPNRGAAEILHDDHHRAERFCRYHDRMPALLAEKNYDAWLCGSAGVELLRPASENLLQRWPVSRRVNSSKESADDPTLIDPVAAPHT